jgi:hypothetical protein
MIPNLMADPLMDRAETCRFFGGNKPIDPSSLYRGIRKGGGLARSTHSQIL